jgi:hypothetical protein
MKISHQLRRAFEARIITVYEPKLKRYEQEITASIHQQYPLNQDTRQKLQQLQQELGLSNKIVASIEARVTKAYVQKLQQCEQEITASIHQQYPLNQDTRQQLQLQQSLGLREEIIDEIEARVTQAYEQKLQQYYHDACQQLQLLRQNLNLSKEAVASIEKPITAPTKVEQKQKLQQYQSAFARAIQRQYPLSDDEHDSLETFRRVLNLSEEITTTIEKQVTQGYEQKLQQYQSAFTRAIQRQYPLSDDEHDSLETFRRVLNLSETITTTIEKQITQGYEQKLQQYQSAFTRAIQRQYPLSDDEHELLENLRRVLNLSETITDEIEAEVTETYNLTPRLPTGALQGGEDKEKVWRMLLKATVVAAAFVSVSLAGYAHIQSQAYQSAAALESTKFLKKGKKYQECVNQASAVPQKSRFYADAQNLLNECQRLAQDEKRLAQAKELAKQNNFKDAIAEANKIQPNSSFRSSAQQLISQCFENPNGVTNPSKAMPDEDSGYLW